jgi:hypothetical protein
MKYAVKMVLNSLTYAAISVQIGSGIEVILRPLPLQS